jgi:hypothetical protein
MNEPTSPDDMLLDEQGVDALVKKLYNLKHHGENLEHIKYVIASSLEETSRERPYRVQTSGRSKYRARGNGKRNSGHKAEESQKSQSSSSSANKSLRIKEGRGHGSSIELTARPLHPETSYAEVTRQGSSHEPVYRRFFSYAKGLVVSHV